MRQIQQKQTNIPFAPLPSASRQFYVDKGGNDANNGSVTAPFLTIAHAIAAVNALGDASTTKRYDIMVGPGDWADVIVLPSWVWIIGNGDVLATRLNGAVSLDPALWAPNIDQRGGFSDLILRGAITIDFNAAASNQGKVYFNNVTINNTPSLVGYFGPGASGINQVFFQHCFMFAGFTQTGITTVLDNTAFINGGTITLTSIGNGSNVPTQVVALGGGMDTTVPATAIHAVWTVGAPPSGNSINIDLFGFGMAGAIILDGAQVNYKATAEGLPLPASLSLLNSAPLPVALSPAFNDGGNATGADETLGPTDFQALIVQTNGTRRLKFFAGNETVFGPADPTLPFAFPFGFVGVGGVNRLGIDPDAAFGLVYRSNVAGGPAFEVVSTGGGAADRATVALQTTTSAFYLQGLPAADPTLGSRGFAVFDANASAYRLLINAVGQVALGGNAPDPSAALEIQSTTLGFLPPRMLTVSRNAIPTPTAGLIIFDQDDVTPQSYDGANWRPMTAQNGGPVTLVGGQFHVSGVTLAPSSVIAVTVGTSIQGGGTTVFYTVREADRVNGAGGTGSFTISALQADGTTLNNLDVSQNVRWAIVG